jgi:hypothetical protein
MAAVCPHGMSGESRTCARSRASLRRALKALLLRARWFLPGKGQPVFDLLHKRKYLLSMFTINRLG